MKWLASGLLVVAVGAIGGKVAVHYLRNIPIVGPLIGAHIDLLRNR